jgi:pyruvate formate lyase activating enzyme
VNTWATPGEDVRAPSIQERGVVFDIMRYCLHDGPGIRTTIFLKGCPLRCSWCHNPEGRSGGIELSFREDRCVRCGDCFEFCPNGAVRQEGDRFLPVRENCASCGTCVDHCYAGARELIGREMSVGEVFYEILKDVAFYDQSGGGVTFSGGEPLFQPRFLEAVCEACRPYGIHRAVETTGFCGSKTMQRIASVTDLFLYDLKIMDDEAHRRFTGAGNEQILRNLVELSQAGSEVIVRMPVLPGINDHESNLREMATFLSTKTKVQEIHLLPFHRIGHDKSRRIGQEASVMELPVPSGERMQSLASYFRERGLRVTMGG